ncbi:MAG: hypothetical protein WBQ17_05410 [Rhizomicrobium sp.]
MIAAEIRADWKNMDGAAEAYLQNFENCTHLSTRSVMGTAFDAVIGFSHSCQTWKGETARRVKAELRAMLKAHGHRR